MSYSLLHCHSDKGSNVCFLDCINKPKDIVKKCIELNIEACAITDHGTICAHMEMLEAAQKAQSEGKKFKPIFGIEGYLIDEKDYKNTRNFYHIIFLAKDLKGLEQLRILSSKSWERSYFERGIRRIPIFYQDIEELEEKGHLIVSTACLGSELDKRILAHDVQGVRVFLSWLIKNFGRENVFLELQPNDNSPEQIEVNKKIIAIAEQTKIPYIITTDAHYINKEDKRVHEAFLNSREASGFRETSPFYDYTYIMDESEIYSVMERMGLSHEQIRIGLENTNKVAEMIEEMDFHHSTIIPTRLIPNFQIIGVFSKWYDVYPFLKKYAESSAEQDRYLLYSMEKNIVEKGYKITDKEAERINIELEVLNGLSEYHKQPMSAYLNLVKDIIDIIWQVSPVMPGRGSCSGFLTCYYMGITQINPLDYDLPWFRFLNLGRVDDFPDIDIDVSPTKATQILELLRERYGQDCVLNTLTYKTESLKAAILTAARGLGVNNDEAQEMSSLVPVKRGKMPSLEGCVQGDEEIGTPPVPQLISLIRNYDGLYEAIEKIQGLCFGIGIHASSVYIFSQGYLKQNALMRAPNNTLITAFDMHESDKMGALKFDLLKTLPPQLFSKAMEYMLKDKVISWEGSLRKTWDKYFHPSVIDYSNQELWENMADGKVLQLFQFGDSQVGSNTIKKIRPKSLVEMAMANDVMRLQGTINGETPTDRFVRYKYNYHQAIQEMKDYGLNDEEIALVEKHFGESYTVSNEQEQLMNFLLDEKISGFPLREVNQARKILAKKQTEKVPGLKEKFFTEGKMRNNREIFLQFAWDRLLLPQLSYSFSRNHSVAYSAIGAIESWIVTKYNPLYWDAAVLSVQAGGEADDTSSMEDILFDNGTDEEAEDEIDESEKNKKINTTNYGKIARGIGLVQSHGIKVALPDINKSELDFTPSILEKNILFGLGGIVGVNPDLANAIISNRPYSSMEQFISLINPTTVQMVSLIKSGCFDNLYPEQSRGNIMEKYLNYIASGSVAKKQKLTMANFDKLVEYNQLPSRFNLAKRIRKYKNWIDKNEFEAKNKRYCLTSSATIKFFKEFYSEYLTLGKEYDIIPNGFSVKAIAIKKVTENYLSLLKEWMNSEEAVEVFYKAEIENKKSGIRDKYCRGSISRWEMQSVSFYYHPHELSLINLQRYGIVNFDSLPEITEPSSYKTNRNGDEVPVYNVKTIAGTIINVDNIKHIVTIISNFGTVVDIKFYAGQFINLYKTISTIGEDGKKKVIEKPWLARGNLILVTGIRRENSFVPKTNWDMGEKYSVRLITEIIGEDLVLKNKREEI